MVSRQDIEEARARLGLRPEAPQGFAPQQSGPFGFLSPIADLGRAIVPQGVRDIAGTVAQDLLSAEEFLNVPGFQLGTGIRGQLERVPRVGGALGLGFDVGLAPATLIPGAAGGRLAVAAGRGLGGRLGAEAAVALGTVGAAAAAQRGVQEAERRGLPVPGVVKVGLPLAAGVLTGARGMRALGPRPVEQIRPAFSGELEATANKFAQVLEEAKPIRENTLRAQSVERTKRVAEMEALTQRPGETFEEFTRRRGALRAGELPKAQIEPISDQFSQTEIDSLIRAVDQHPAFEQLILTRQNLGDAVRDLIYEGRIPQAAQATKLKEVFGTRTYEAMVKGLPVDRSKMEAIAEVSGLMRSLNASFDFSAFRQSLLLSRRSFLWKNASKQLKWWRNEDVAQAEMTSLRNRPNAKNYGLKEDNPLLTNLDLRAKPLEREEAFRSTIAQDIPLIGRVIRASDRAYTVFLNRLRADYFDYVFDKMKIAGEVTPDDIKALREATLIMTGRGTLPSSSGQMMAILNAAFFSPRLLWARLQTGPLTVKATVGAVTGRTLRGGKLTPAQRALQVEIASDVTTVFGAGMAGLSLLWLGRKQLPFPVEIEFNPQSSDFGKVRIGNTRLDPWGGFQQIARYMAQGVTGQRVITGAGDTQDIDRWDVGAKFLQSKMAPLPGLLLDLARGRTFLGEEVVPDITEEVFATRVIPFFLQDMHEALTTEGAWGGVLGLPGLVGVGITSFRTTAGLQNEIAYDEFGKKWDDLTNGEQARLRQTHEQEFGQVRIKTEFDAARTELQEDIREREQGFARAYEAGNDPKLVSQLLFDLDWERVTKTNQLFKDFGFESKVDPDDIVAQIFSKLEEAEVDGITDFQLRDEMLDGLLAGLTPEQRQKWEDRWSFIHDPSVQTVFDQRRYIRDAGYFQVRDDAFERFEPRLQSIAPEIQTYIQLVRAINIAEREGNRGRQRRLNGVKTRIDRIATRKRKTLRRKDPLLQEAGVTVYGWKPLR